MYNSIPEETKKPLAYGAVALMFALVLFVFFSAVNAVKEYRYIGQRPNVQNTISVSGEGEVFAVADTAQFSVTVTEEAETVNQAQTQATEDMNAIIAYLEDEGVDEADIKTINYSVNPRYENRPVSSGERTMMFPRPDGTRVLVGYEVRQTIQVKIDDTELAGSLLSGVGEREADQVSGLSFTIDDTQELEQQARSQAIKNAQDNARVLANDLGVQLVRIVNFSTNNYYPQAMRATFDTAMGMGGDVMESAPAPNLPTGENRITSTVQITYEIK